MSSPSRNAPESQSGAAVVFAKAYENFRNGLSDEEKKVFTDFADSQALVASIQTVAKQHHVNESRITACCEAVNNVGQKLMPYFKVIDIFVSSHPEYAALLWGAIRLMFVLGMNYVAFLEKFCTMLEHATRFLPAYESLIEWMKWLEQERATNPPVRELSPRLPDWLSLIYVDILQFCQEACNILSGKRGIRAKTKLVWNLSWRPFDVRFGQIIERFKEHQQFIDNEIRVTQIEITAVHYVDFQKELLEAERRRQEDDYRRKEKEQRALEKRIREIKQWIDPPDWELPYEDICNRRCEGTGEWLFCEPAFQTWEDDLRTAWSSLGGKERRLLFIQGKPGYGKTYLCALLIQKYREAKHSLHPGGQGDPSPDVVFYFFDKRRGDKAQRNAMSAFRAILTQLIHLHSEDRYTLDMASIFLTEGSQRTATKMQILNLLHWYLKEYPQTIIVIDGLDESEDPKEVLSGLTPTYGSLFATKSGGKTGDDNRTPAVAIFMRPDTALSRLSRETYHRLSLQDSHNSEDVGTFLREQFSTMAALEGVDLKDAVRKATIHANGMFLWAKLLVEYLESDFLCDDDVSAALENMVHLEGLDALYAAIFSSLHTRRTGPARENSKRTFEWVTFSHRPLHIDELEAAVSISGFKEISQTSRIKRFEESLGPASGALLELAQDRTVHFIHTSVKEYLSSRIENSFIRHGADLELDMAACCLFYLTKCVPSGPLSGCSQTTPDKTVIQAKFPLVKYSLESWYQHSMRGIEALAEIGWPVSTMGLSVETFVKYLSVLSLDKVAVTTWIEASWLFDVPPTVSGLSQFARSALSKFHVSETVFHGLSHIAEHLAQLDCDLLELNQEWGKTLRAAPNEIWEPSIPAFNDFPLWMKTKDANTKKLQLSTQGGNVLTMSLRSQVSADGKEFGVLRLCIPRSFTTGLSIEVRGKVSLSDWASICAGSWTSTFEVWSLQDDTVKLRIVLNLPSEDIEPWLITWATTVTTSASNATQGWHSYSDWWFTSSFLHMPCAIAPDLRRFLVLGCIAVVDQDTPGTRSEHSYGTSDGCKLKVKCFRPWFSKRGRRYNSSAPTQMKLNSYTSAQQKVEKEANARLSVYHFGALFSPSGNALLLLRPTLDCNVEKSADPLYARDWQHEKPKPKWELTVFSNLLESTWKHKTILEFPVTTGNAAHKLDEFCTFHPVLPVLAFSTSKLCRMWHFEKSDAGAVVNVDRERLSHLSFSTCGNYLHAENSSGSFLQLKVVDKLNKILPAERKLHTHTRSGRTDIPTQSQDGGDLSIQKIEDQKLPATQTSNSVLLGRNGSSVATMSMLTHLKEENAIILRTLREDGMVRNETLARIPEMLKESEPVSIPSSDSESSDNVRLVFNVTRRDRWTIDDAMREPEMPVILERTKKSIPTFIGSIAPTIKDSSSRY